MSKHDFFRSSVSVLASAALLGLAGCGEERGDVARQPDPQPAEISTADVPVEPGGGDMPQDEPSGSGTAGIDSARSAAPAPLREPVRPKPAIVTEPKPADPSPDPSPDPHAGHDMEDMSGNDTDDM